MRHLILAVALCGCVSAGHPESAPDTRPGIISGSDGTLFGDETRPSVATIGASQADVWRSVTKVYGQFDVPITIANLTTHQIGNPSFFKTRRFAGLAMQTLVDCGAAPSGPKAATYRIYMSLLTDVLPDTNGSTKIRTTLVPVGQDMSGGSGDRITCGTTGRIESMLIDSVRAAVGKR